ncbi:hypothetical protein DH2020_043582 [Rehmannia glutinosa]|uniref:PB1-like domain-containing protein n=1 Tax=Rehmannia glutinosa TaxID=99300 RepID=A0ABR0UJA9_REHGL
MSWQVREKSGQSSKESLHPDYGPISEFFTIRLHHSGMFVNLGKMLYCGGDINHVDYCDVDKMSLLELHSMAKEIGVKEYKRFHYNKVGIDDCSDLVVIENDIDALNLVNCIDENRIVGVFVEHEKSNPTDCSESESSHELPIVDEPLEFVGNSVDGIEQDQDDFDECLNEIHDNNESNESEHEGEQSVESDSELSDNFFDSDWDVSDDDVLFDTYIDEEVEWGVCI